MADFLILGLVGALIVIIVYYLTKQRQHHKGDGCTGCSEKQSACTHCDVETLKKALKEELTK